MSSMKEKYPWTVYERVKVISIAPEALMAEIDSAMATLEFARATTFLQSLPPIPNSDRKSACQYDARMADIAYRSGLASIATGKLDEAIRSLKFALSKCPPDRSSAIAKLESLITLTSVHMEQSSDRVT